MEFGTVQRWRYRQKPDNKRANLSFKITKKLPFPVATYMYNVDNHHHHHLPPWIRSFDLFRHRRVAIVSWGVRDPFFPGVCR
jgi:hypothetical protein